ncbi:uncharacterized protein TRAVEDRAFT_39125 [Trametes versicolor FP-101664 SS1]|uniref:uncharacterized protein n=1 Tax=Trametes versicolor (strain FP-101664) TaxID=717944 RepID=UPI0004623DEB|nr:uncharacterized protein TRAVEDRAFT_39125 [Trametes versicolor FP-101664 SS1]EIW56103.1 hypothetical protein TRAVEDRAFT_39125 [Trametes versicolor FP-101664 SS1]
MPDNLPGYQSDGGVSYRDNCRSPGGSPVPDIPLRPPTPAGSDDEDDEDAINVADLYVDIEELFDQILEDEEAELGDTLPTAYTYETGRPRTLQEHPLIRNAYLHVYLASAVHGATKELCKHLLDGYHVQLAALPRVTGFTVPGLENMARTLRTVERRLGVDPNQYITYYFACNVCWSHHHPRELYNLDSHLCTEPDCPGTLFEYKDTVERKRKRIPVKVIPTTGLIDSIVRMAARPGKIDDWNKWRGEDDAAGRIPPADSDDWGGWNDPSYRMFDMMDGWGWRSIRAGLERRRSGEWGVEDVDVDEMDQCFVALPNGLILQINIDWFRAMKRGGYSVGAVYITVCNNPCSVRFRREETLLYCVLPGPLEPTTEQLNRLLAPLLTELQKLYNGILIRNTCENSGPAEAVHAFLNNICSDLPAAHKANGLRGHTCEHFMCDRCEVSFSSLVTPACFDTDSFRHRNDWRFLKYAYLWRDADPDDQAEIFEKRGVQWSLFNWLPDWLPGRDSPPDFMHGAYLGETKHVIQSILFKGGMFTQRSRRDKPLEKFEAYLKTIVWPPSVTRLPDGLISGGAGKADQWRAFVHVLIPGLYAAWNVDGDIPDKNTPLPRASTKAAKGRARVEELLNKRRRANVAADPETTLADMEELAQLCMNRNYLQHFNVTMEWACAIRIYGSQSISVAETERAANCHERACQTWTRMFCHLVPYFHILMHLWYWILMLGLVYGWWTYPYKRNNGFLAKLRHNGKVGGEIEATMMRGWTKAILLFELIQHLEDLGDQKTPEDIAMITKLRGVLKGDASKSTAQCGTLLTLIASMSASNDTAPAASKAFTQAAATVDLSPHPQIVDLRSLGVYALLYHYLRALWADVVELKPDTAPAGVPGECFVATAVQSHATINVCGLRYGAGSTPRGAKSRYAYRNGRQPVEISHIFHITHLRDDPTLPPLHASCAIVQDFASDDGIPEMPWALRAVDLGIGTWVEGILCHRMVIDVRDFSGHFALATVTHQNQDLWITMSLSHVRTDWDFLCHLANIRGHPQNTQEPDNDDQDDV